MGWEAATVQETDGSNVTSGVLLHLRWPETNVCEGQQAIARVWHEGGIQNRMRYYGALIS